MGNRSHIFEVWHNFNSGNTFINRAWRVTSDSSNVLWTSVSNWITSDCLHCISGTEREKFLGVLMESLKCCECFVEKVILKNREFKQISTAGAAMATRSKIVQKRVIAQVSISHPAVAGNPFMPVGRFWHSV